MEGRTAVEGNEQDWLHVDGRKDHIDEHFPADYWVSVLLKFYKLEVSTTIAAFLDDKLGVLEVNLKNRVLVVFSLLIAFLLIAIISSTLVL